MSCKNATLFISDLHLDANEPQGIRTFFYFLEHIAVDADALYILGDFFERYIGDDDRNQLSHSITEGLTKLVNAGCPVFLMRGNRDFLIGKAFAKRASATLISDPSVITLYNKKILLMHGDSLCTQDKNYQRFRKIIRSRLFRLISLSSPLSWRRKSADKLREKSRQANQHKTMEIMDVSEEAVTSAIKKYQAEKLIHGHTHRPGIHANRIVLDAWHDHGNYLRVDRDGKMALVDF